MMSFETDGSVALCRQVPGPTDGSLKVFPAKMWATNALLPTDA